MNSKKNLRSILSVIIFSAMLFPLANFSSASALSTGLTSPLDTSLGSSSTISNTTTSVTAATNITTTTGSISTGNPTGVPLPNSTTSTGASTTVDGVQVFGNGTITTSINGVSMNFLFDPNGPAKAPKPTGGTSAIITVKSSDLSGNSMTGIWDELHSSTGSMIGHGYTTNTYSITTGKQYIVYVSNWQNIVFDHWDDGSTNPYRTITPTQSVTLTAYFSTGSTSATAPQPPTSLVATAASTSQINLSWTAPSNNGGSAITGYKIERSMDTGSTWSTLVSNTGSTSTTYSNTGLSPNTTYTYRVSAINSIGTGSPSNVSTATTSTQILPPQPPTGLTATTVSSSQINLSWSAPADNGGSPVTGYKIERSVDAGSTWSTVVANTSSTSTAFSDMGLAANTSYTYRVSAINSVGTSSPSNTASATTGTSSGIRSVTQVQSGLVASDSLTNETMTQQQLQAGNGYWAYAGDAPAEKAPYSFSRDAQGLHIDVQAPSSGTWAGFFAESPNTNAVLFHSVITTPVRTVPSQNYENGMYVQTSNGLINYVTCVSLTNTQATSWAIINTYGTTNQATKFTVLWMDNSANQPLTRDCTIITNGQNYLKVYMDGTMVYTSNSLNLQMPAPYNTYLEPETSYSGQLLSGTFQDYYVSSDETIKVINNPSNAARADIVDSTGTILGSSQVSGGTAILDVGKFHYPLSASIKVYDSSNNLIASGPVNIYGGSVYSVNQ